MTEGGHVDNPAIRRFSYGGQKQLSEEKMALNTQSETDIPTQVIALPRQLVAVLGQLETRMQHHSSVVDEHVNLWFF